MKFITPSVAVEFGSDEVDPRIRAIVRELSDQLIRKFNYEVTVTDVLRAQSEEEKLNPAVKLSPHVDRPGRAVDLRRKDMTPEVGAFVEQFLARWWPEAKLLKDDRGPAHPHYHVHVPKMA